MTCDIGLLKAYLDNTLALDEQAAVMDHLAGCASCQENLSMLQQQGTDVAVRLATLDPQPHDIPDAAQALARFHAQMQSAQISRLTILKRRIDMTRQTVLTGRWRPAAIGLIGLAFVVALFSFAPVRQAAAQFLGIFRVRKFAVIPIDPARVEELERLGDQFGAGTLLGEHTVLREPGEPQDVADAAAATALAGFPVREPTNLPDGANRTRFTVEAGPAVRFEVDRAVAEAVLEAGGVDVTLPFDTATIEVDFPAMVHQEFRTPTARLEIIQMPSPTVTLPPGVDPAPMGEILLRFLGLPAEDAQRLAQTIDWTSTFIIPLPTDVGRAREVEIDGVSGVLLEPDSHSPEYPGGLLLWQRDDIIYGVSGDDIRASELVQIAESLQ